MPRLRSIRSSRRATGLKDSDYDHEIGLVDHDAPPTNTSAETTEVVRSTTGSALLPQGEATSSSQAIPEPGPSRQNGNEEGASDQDASRTGSRDRAPSIEIQEATPYEVGPATVLKVVKKKRPVTAEREFAIDILYENERGGFLCGVALFSAAALGNLDPPAWTNEYHKPSPTDIHTAQVPDPTWEWAWPEWRVNHDEGVDESGWEYSFMFSRKFSWHGPRWWNSFVRRRAWIRKRVKKIDEEMSADPHMLSTEYFNIQPASEKRSRSRSHSRSQSRTHSRSASGAGSLLGSRASTGQLSKMEGPEELEEMDIEDMQTLMDVLKMARIDREKLEAVENYLDHADKDLVKLKDEMHEVMRIFVFQASRKLLLAHITRTLDETIESLEKEDSARLRARKEHLAAAVKSADEEVRKLAYWSDVKEMVEGGVSKGGVDGQKGWSADWQGVDQSGPAAPNDGKIP